MAHGLSIQFRLRVQRYWFDPAGRPLFVWTPWTSGTKSTERCSRSTHEDLVDLRQLRQSPLNNGVNLRWEWKIWLLADSLLGHSLPRSNEFLAESTAHHRGAGSRDLRHKKFVKIDFSCGIFSLVHYQRKFFTQPGSLRHDLARSVRF